MLMSIPQCIISKFPDTQSMITYKIFTEYFWKFQWNNCVVGMFLACPINQDDVDDNEVKEILKKNFTTVRCKLSQDVLHSMCYLLL